MTLIRTDLGIIRKADEFLDFYPVEDTYLRLAMINGRNYYLVGDMARVDDRKAIAITEIKMIFGLQDRIPDLLQLNRQGGWEPEEQFTRFMQSSNEEMEAWKQTVNKIIEWVGFDYMIPEQSISLDYTIRVSYSMASVIDTLNAFGYADYLRQTSQIASVGAWHIYTQESGIYQRMLPFQSAIEDIHRQSDQGSIAEMFSIHQENLFKNYFSLSDYTADLPTPRSLRGSPLLKETMLLLVDRLKKMNNHLIVMSRLLKKYENTIIPEDLKTIYEEAFIEETIDEPLGYIKRGDAVEDNECTRYYFLRKHNSLIDQSDEQVHELFLICGIGYAGTLFGLEQAIKGQLVSADMIGRCSKLIKFAAKACQRLEQAHRLFELGPDRC